MRPNHKPAASLHSILPYLKWLFVAVILWFVGRSIVSQLARFDWRHAHFRAVPLAGAAVCLTLIYAARTVSFRLLLMGYAKLGHFPPPTWRQMAVVAWVPQLAKYVPGQVASIVGAMGFLRKFGIGAVVGLSVVLVMDGLAVLTGVITGSPLLLWEPVRRQFPAGWILCVAIIIAGVIMMLPGVYGRAINFVLRKTKRPLLESMPPMRNYVGPVMLGFMQWVLAGLALWLTARSVVGVSLGQVWVFTAIGALGYTAGYISPLPGGLGVRDAIFQGTLTLLIGGSAALVVVTVRVIQTIVEIVMAGAGVIVLRKLERGGPADARLAVESGSSRETGPRPSGLG
jgi:glycosyltransferase 2 family protein